MRFCTFNFSSLFSCKANGKDTSVCLQIYKTVNSQSKSDCMITNMDDSVKRGQIETLQHILSPLFSAFLGVINTYM